MKQSGQGGFDLEGDKKRALALTPVSRETETRLLMFVELLLLWQEKQNLVGSSTLPLIWTRHIADSLQLLLVAPEDSVGLHLKALARVSRLLKAPEFRARLLTAPDQSELYRTIREEDDKY